MEAAREEKTDAELDTRLPGAGCVRPSSSKNLRMHVGLLCMYSWSLSGGQMQTKQHQQPEYAKRKFGLDRPLGLIRNEQRFAITPDDSVSSLPQSS